MEGFVTQSQLIEEAGISLPTLYKFNHHLGIKPKSDSYDKRLKLYNEEQVEKIMDMASRIKYTKKEASNG